MCRDCLHLKNEEIDRRAFFGYRQDQHRANHSFPVLSTNGLWILHHKTLRSAWDVSVKQFWRVGDCCDLPKVVSLERNGPDFPMNTLFS